MNRLLLLLYVLLFPFLGKTQVPEDLRKVSKESFPNNEYYIELPPKSETKGLMMVFPGLFDHPYSIFFETDLVSKAQGDGYMVVIPVMSEENDHLSLSTESMRTLDKIIENIFEEHNLEPTIPFVIGGFSMGGSRAIKYHSYLLSNSGELSIDAIFAIDPPLDFERLVTTSLLPEEATILLDRITKEYKNRSSIKEILQEISLFNPRTLNNNNGIDMYLKTKLRIYCEPDILWYIEHRGGDLYNMNILDAAGYINTQKKINQNNQVELVITEGKGYRKGSNERHPHSWNIMDVDDLLIWINK